jgi:hypothetical protein
MSTPAGTDEVTEGFSRGRAGSRDHPGNERALIVDISDAGAHAIRFHRRIDIGHDGTVVSLKDGTRRQNMSAAAVARSTLEDVPISRPPTS